MKLAVSAYSFYQYIGQGKMSIYDTVDKAAEMGFCAIEFLDMPGGSLDEQKESAKKLKALAKDAKIDICAYTIGAELFKGDVEADKREVERLKAQAEIASVLGAKIMRHDVCYNLKKSGKGRSFDLMLPTIAENARIITEYAKGLGIRTCVENHGYIAQDSDRLERLFCAVDHDNFGLLVDIGNFVCVDEDNATAVSRLAPYAIHVHAKDMYYSREFKYGWGQTRGCNYFAGAAVGQGDVDVKKCIEILRRAGYDGYLSVEYEGADDCIVGIEKSRDYLGGILN